MPPRLGYSTRFLFWLLTTVFSGLLVQTAIAQESAIGLLKQMIAIAADNGGAGRGEELNALKQRIEGLPKPERGDKRAARAENDQGLLAFKAGQLDQAKRHFLSAYQTDGADVEIAGNLGLIHLKLGEYKQALTLLAAALTLSPGRSSTWLNLAEYYARQNQQAEAVACYALAFQFSQRPDKTRAFLNRLATGDDSAQVRQAAQRVLQLGLLQGPGTAPAEESLEAPLAANLSTPSSQTPSMPSAPVVPSFDCGKAKTAIEKAICGDSVLMALDAQLADAYKEVRALSSPDEGKMLALAQVSWVSQRDSACAEKVGRELNACIQEQTSTRLRLLRGQPDSGPGVSGRIIPVFLMQKGDTRQYELDVQLLRFLEAQGPAQQTLNAISQALLKDIPSTPDEDTMGHTYAHQAWLRLAYASPRLISVEHGFAGFTGGAHGFAGIKNFNIDMGSGKLLGVADLFPAATLPGLLKLCRDQLILQKRERWGTEPYDPASDDFLKEETIAEHIGSLERWGFSEQEAAVSFDAYAIASYAEGTFECRFALDDLRARALPNAPLPGASQTGQ